ncbi:A disintegrin and metalloproteinase with thrombospondin motifs 4-like isoform X2 [Acanthaster planci]|uniref:A disintegrin and metalloproteinase with thrombospondin motifs 4-like isoform X2 n=1 Tax=Acanthaster planci TaxID=133434 RepID=A0A8B7ZDT0_ACAPL|nr:A disintegrin and metalloproteinase with thrombospondin motifs 4-like isoform X2 [Acanthaster planci]
MMLKIVVLAVLVSTACSKPGVLNKDDEFSTEELIRYFGVENHAEAPEYEVVYPLVVDADSKRSVGNGAIAASFLELEVEAFGETLILNVDHDDSNYAPGLEVEIYTDEGIQRVPLRTDCVYTGKVAGEQNSIASVTTCDGLMAVIFRNDGRGELYIEPLEDKHAAKRDVGRGHPHVAYKNRPQKGGAFCSAIDPPIMPISAEEPVDTESTKYLELAFIADPSYTSSRGSTSSATTCVNTLFNAVKNVLQLSSLRGTALVPKLVYVKIFGATETGLTSNTDSNTYLATCRAWQHTNNKPSSSSEHWDNAAFFTGVDISSPDAGNAVLGVGYVSGCDYWGASLSEFRSLDATAVTAHEIGHNLGMYHDSSGPEGGPYNSCSSKGYLMAAYNDNHQKDLGWSTCSRSYYDTRITQTTCYNDA